MKQSNYYESIVLFLGFIGLVLSVLVWDGQYFWDEPYYYNNLDLLIKYGLSAEFLKQEWGSAGPLYSMVHYVFLPWTEGKLPYIRFINISLLVISLVLMYGLTKRTKYGKGESILVWLAVPMTYVCAGIAFTEFPAIVCLLLALLAYTQSTSETGFGTWGWKLVAGCFFTLAIIGRQPYLVLLPCFFLLEDFDSSSIVKKSLAFLMFAWVSLAVPIFIFYQWNGLLAPKEQSTTSGWALFHFWLGLGYCGLVIALIAPGFFIRMEKSVLRWIGSIFLVIVALNYFFQWFYFLPMQSTFYPLLPWSICLLFASFFASVVLIGGSLMLWTIGYRLLESNNQKIMWFCGIGIVFLMLTSIKITHQYSSRYAFQAVPLIVWMVLPWIKPSPWNAVRYALGVGIGWVSLYSYLT